MLATSIPAVEKRTMAGRLASTVAGALPPLVALFGLLTPLIAVAGRGIPLVGMGEESIGYRYFYSLRILYTEDERPWLPQGQTMGVVHLGLQALLTTLGYPPTQLRPRIEVFAVVGAAFAVALVAVALAWAVRPLPGLLPRLAVALGLVAVALDPATTSGYYLLLPDYPTWTYLVAMVSLGVCLRLTEPSSRPGLATAVSFGTFVGLALALKITMAAHLAAPALILATRWRPARRLVVGGALTAFVAVLTAAGTTILYFRGSVAALQRFVRLLSAFSGGVGADTTAPFPAWALAMLGSGEVPARLAVLLPAILGASALALRPRVVSAALLVGSIASLAVLWKRPTSTTVMEAYGVALVAVVVWSARVGAPAVAELLARRTASGHQARRLGRAAMVLGVVALAGLAGYRAWAAPSALVPSFAQAAELERRVAEFTAQAPGKVAILTLDNAHNPLSIDSAIFKGGTDVYETELWSASPFVAALVPERWYFYNTPELRTPIDLGPFTYVLFAAHDPPERVGRTIERLRATFGVSLVGPECVPLAARPVGGYQYGCRRRPDAPIEARDGAIGFLAHAGDVAPDALVDWPDGQRRAPRPGETAYAASSRDVWRLDADGGFTRLVGRRGQTVTIDSLGMWSPRRGATTGLEATFDGFAWVVEPAGMRAANRNANLRLDADGTLRGWSTLDARDRASVERRTDGADEWLELRPRAPGARTGVRASLDLANEPRAPVSAVVTVRAFGAAEAVVRLQPRGGPSDERPGRVARVAGIGAWRTVVVHLPAGETSAHPELIVELEGGREGERLDVRKGELFVGRHP